MKSPNDRWKTPFCVPAKIVEPTNTRDLMEVFVRPELTGLQFVALSAETKRPPLVPA